MEKEIVIDRDSGGGKCGSDGSGSLVVVVIKYTTKMMLMGR